MVSALRVFMHVFGNAFHNFQIESMKLRELEIGDMFIAESDKKKTTKFVVRNNTAFNYRHISGTRFCVVASTGEIVSKSANLDVIKTGESKHKQKLQQLYGVKKLMATSQ